MLDKGSEESAGAIIPMTGLVESNSLCLRIQLTFFIYLESGTHKKVVGTSDLG